MVLPALSSPTMRILGGVREHNPQHVDSILPMKISLQPVAHVHMDICKEYCNPTIINEALLAVIKCPLLTRIMPSVWCSIWNQNYKGRHQDQWNAFCEHWNPIISSWTVETTSTANPFLCAADIFGCESSPISRNVHSLVSQLVSQSVSALDKCKIRLNKAK